MRITKPGNDRAGFEGKWECDKCGCEWIMDATDDKPTFATDPRGVEAYHMPCPTCKVVTYRLVPKLSEVPG